MNGAVEARVNSYPKSRATIANMPWGPLENAILFLREYDLAQLLQVCKDLSTVDSEAFWRERCCDAFGRHLSCIQVRYLAPPRRARGRVRPLVGRIPSRAEDVQIDSEAMVLVEPEPDALASS